jgi:hypothetical protein
VAKDSGGKFVESFKAAGDLSGKQYLGVILSADDTVQVPAAANDNIIGILENKPAAANRGARVACGFVKFRAGSAIAYNVPITVAASGYVIEATSGHRIVGQCLRTVTSGYLGFGFIMPPGFVAASSVEAGNI